MVAIKTLVISLLGFAILASALPLDTRDAAAEPCDGHTVVCLGGLQARTPEPIPEAKAEAEAIADPEAEPCVGHTVVCLGGSEEKA
ncbi:hypothetical protein BP6252_06842 [Coleophoma cylindrospora]|uniref:Secreted protein n=1 Tax=Coleophoma cylindrospora TaxID=1849047 RepID=A0A3D8RFW0_9HELO|nr:hypothetical protein BP6252_06842 [Coleophoma cylindrospora]